MASKRWFIAAAFVLSTSWVALSGGTPAGAVRAQAAAYNCNGGTAASPQNIPAGTYSSLVVGSTGTCAVGGAVTVTGDTTVASGGALLDAFATAPLTVDGNVFVRSGSLAILGCEPNFFPCFDNGNGTSSITIKGSLVSLSALTVVTHALAVHQNIAFLDGGGGVSCPNAGPHAPPIPGSTPAVNFMNANGIPPYFDNEDNNVAGNVWITGIKTCWIGSLRNHVGGSLLDAGNTMADPDAGEVLANHVDGNLICVDNNPANQFGDSGSTSNVVGGTALGQCAFGLVVPNVNGTPPDPTPLSVPSPKLQGYDLGAGDGGVFTFGSQYYGSVPGTNEIFNYSGIATAPGGHGYWILNGSGHVVAFGPNAPFLGDPQNLMPNAPLVGIAASPIGDGYYVAGADGGVFNEGPGAVFFGSAGNLRLAKPVVGIATAPFGDGYYLVAKDGGVFTYGPGAVYQGSMGGQHVNAPIVGMAVDPVTGGYWLVGADGGVYTFHARFFGSLGGRHLNQPIVGIVAAPGGNGYYLVAKDGGVFTMGPGAHYQGGTGGMALNQPVDGMALG